MNLTLISVSGQRDILENCEAGVFARKWHKGIGHMPSTDSGSSFCELQAAFLNEDILVSFLRYSHSEAPCSSQKELPDVC